MSQMHRILHLSTVTHPRAGVGQIIQAIHREAPRFGYESFRVAGYGRQEDAEYTLISKVQYRINALRARLFEDDGFLRSRAMTKLKGILRDEKPDILHLHNLHGYYCDIRAVRTIADNLKLRLVLTLHDLWPLTGRCAYTPHGRCDLLDKNKCGSCQHLKRYPAKWIKGKSRLNEKKAFIDNITLVAPSRWVSDRAMAHKIHILPNGIDENVFHPFSEIKKEKKTLLSVATRWTDEKGRSDLVRLANNLPDGWRIRVVGDNAPIHESIDRVGFIEDPNKLAQMMAQSSALYHPSHSETFGLTVAESLAVETPVIVRRGTASEEYVPDKKFVVDTSNPEEVLKLLDDLDNFDFTNAVPLTTSLMAERYYRLYDSLLIKS